MNTKKIISTISAIAISIAVIAPTASAVPVNNNSKKLTCFIKTETDTAATYNLKNIYSKSTVVTGIKKNASKSGKTLYYTITVEDFNGEEWCFHSKDGDWFIDDICSLTMYDRGTDEIYDDVILKATYSGYNT